MRTTRTELMLKIAQLVGHRGTCPRARVGCIIEKDGRIISHGYNGSPPSRDHCDDVGCKMVDNHCVRTTHAEANAIAWAARMGISTEGATMYVTGWKGGICDTCFKLALSAGIRLMFAEINDKLTQVYPDLLLVGVD